MTREKLQSLAQTLHFPLLSPRTMYGSEHAMQCISGLYLRHSCCRAFLWNFSALSYQQQQQCQVWIKALSNLINAAHTCDYQHGGNPEVYSKAAQLFCIPQQVCKCLQECVCNSSRVQEKGGERVEQFPLIPFLACLPKNCSQIKILSNINKGLFCPAWDPDDGDIQTGSTVRILSLRTLSFERDPSCCLLFFVNVHLFPGFSPGLSL